MVCLVFLRQHLSDQYFELNRLLLATSTALTGKEILTSFINTNFPYFAYLPIFLVFLCMSVQTHHRVCDQSWLSALVCCAERGYSYSNLGAFALGRYQMCIFSFYLTLDNQYQIVL